MQRQLRCSRIRYFLYELFLVVAWLSATEAGSLEVIHSNEDLLAALRNDEVSLILLLDDLTLGREFDELTEPIAVRRCVQNSIAVDPSQLLCWPQRTLLRIVRPVRPDSQMFIPSTACISAVRARSGLSQTYGPVATEQ